MSYLYPLSYPLSGLLADVRAAEDESIFLLHACAHNPTGVDPTREQWAELSKLMKGKKQIAFFDCAYQVSMPPQYETRKYYEYAYRIAAFGDESS